MIDAGQGIVEVAAAFGISILRVQRRLKLANVAPSLIDLFRQNGITLDQLMALAITDDHAQQVAVWEGASDWQRAPQRLRAALTNEEIDAATHPLGRFVGLAAYEAAGGSVRRDLFSEVDGAGYMTDVGLVERLAMDKLRAVAEGLAQEGWAWTEIRTRIDYSELSALGRAPMIRREPTAAETAGLAAVQAQRDALQQEYELLEASVESDDGEVDDARWQEIDDALEHVQASRQALESSLDVPDPSVLGIAGAMVTVDSNGMLDIRRGLIRPEDRKKHVASRTHQPATLDRESTNGEQLTTKGAFPERLYRQLTAHRTAALQLAVAKQPTVGVALLAWRLAAQVFYAEEAVRQERTVQLRIDQSPLERDAPDLPTSPARQQFEAFRAAWTDRLPTHDKTDALLAWMLAADASTLCELIAFCTACTLDDTNSGPDRNPRDIAAEIARVTELDMADWWTATKESFLGAVPKATIIEAVVEARGAEATNPLKAMKRDALVAEAERLLADTRWLPTPLR